jgi:hypothetical protein
VENVSRNRVMNLLNRIFGLGSPILTSKVVFTNSDHMKWAVTWFNEKTIILDSHDVGTYGVDC